MPTLQTGRAAAGTDDSKHEQPETAELVRQSPYRLSAKFMGQIAKALVHVRLTRMEL